MEINANNKLNTSTKHTRSGLLVKCFLEQDNTAEVLNSSGGGEEQLTESPPV